MDEDAVSSLEKPGRGTISVLVILFVILSGFRPMSPVPGASGQTTTGSYGSITIDNPTVKPGGNSLQLPAGSQIYLWGEDSGGEYRSNTFADGTVAKVDNKLGILAAQLGESTLNTNGYPTTAHIRSIGGVGISGFASKTFTFAANGTSGTTSVSVTFAVSAPSVVVVIALQGGVGMYSLSIHGLPGAQIDAAVVDCTNGCISGSGQPMIIAHAFLDAGTYTVTTSVSPNYSDPETSPDQYASLIGVWTFTPSSASTTTTTTGITEFPYQLVTVFTVLIVAGLLVRRRTG